MFKRRSYNKEIMDDFSITDERIKSALIELRTINKYLGGRSTSRKGLGIISGVIGSGKDISILDVGSGGSDNFRSPVKIGNTIHVTSLDINIGVCRFVKSNEPYNNVLCGDALNLPFKESSFDVIHLSLFLHHFNEKQIINLLKNLLTISRYGVIINDLQRSFFAYTGIKLLTFLFSKSDMVKNDAPLSVKRGFIKHELKELISTLIFTSVIIKYRWAFRWLMVILK